MTHHKHTIDLDHLLLHFQLLNATKLIYRKLELWVYLFAKVAQCIWCLLFFHLQELHNAYAKEPMRMVCET
jgi:hypothetical protein